MVEKNPVSVRWQMLFVLIPIIDLWAAYRIQKLRMYLLVFYAAAFIVHALLYVAFVPEEILYSDDPFAPVEFTVGSIIAQAAASIVVIRKWSLKWNETVRQTMA